MGNVTEIGKLFICLLDPKKAKALSDFQLGWFWKLVLKMSFMGGRVPYDGNLWAMAGARSRQNWDAYSGPVIACFRVAEMGNAGKWLVHDELIRMLQENKSVSYVTETKQLNQVPKEQFEVLGELFLKFYKNYPKDRQKKAARKKFDIAIRGFAKENGCSQIDAAEFICNKAAEFSAVIERAGIPKKRVPFPSVWLSGGFRDPPSEWVASCRMENVFTVPDWILPEVWAAFKEMRRQKRQPLGNYAARLIVKKLEGFRAIGNDPVKVLERSIENAWQGVFPLPPNEVQVINGNGQTGSRAEKRNHNVDEKTSRVFDPDRFAPQHVSKGVPD